MKFSNFLRRFNRGIALGIVLVIALAVYIVIDNMQFSKEKNIIKDVITEYTELSGDLILLPEEYREIGKTIPESVIENKLEENNNIINKYFSSGLDQYGSSLFEAIKSSLDSILRENRESGNVIAGCDSSITKISNISKSGSNYAECEVSVKTVIKATQKAEFLRFTYMDYLNNYINDNGEEDMSFSTKTIEFSCPIVVKKVNGTWKIAETNYSWNYSQNIQIGG